MNLQEWISKQESQSEKCLTDSFNKTSPNKTGQLWALTVACFISDIIKNEIPLGLVSLLYTTPEYESYISESCAQ